MPSMQPTMGETAVFGGGCFWCTEAIFQSLRGVVSAVPGYAGGSAPSPTYEQVSGGGTGHAEVVRIEFDPGQISFRDLLEVFFATHDPTTENRQGNDVGEQYRSVIFYASDAQKRTAEDYIAELNRCREYQSPIVTQLYPLADFYGAEEYHRNYYRSNPNKPYCQVVISPKLIKLRQKFANILKPEE